MRCRPRPAVLLALLAMSVPAFAQDSVPAPAVTPAPPADVVPAPAPPTVPRPIRLKHPVPVRKPIVKTFPSPVRRPAAKAALSPARPGKPSGNWIKLNTHLLGTMGETTWVNLAQAVNIRFYQTGNTAFAAIGLGGSSYISTSDPGQIQKLRAYVQTH